MTQQHDTTPTFESDATQVVQTPVHTESVGQPPSAPKASRARWMVALGGAATVVAITAALVVAVVGKSPAATVLGYVPAGAIAYGELRLDLPGDQAQAVGSFLSKFPGFADQAALETKIDETFDRFVATATKDKQTYTKDIKPWFDGELAFSVGALPPASTLDDPEAMPPFRGLALMSLKDGALAQAWFDAALAESGAAVTTEAYGGTTITLSSGPGDHQAGLAIIDGKVAVVGDLESVKAAIDTKGSGPFANEADPKAALAAADSDHLGLVYLAIKPIIEWTTEAQGEILSAPASALSASIVDSLPAWQAMWVRAEGDAIVLEAAFPKPATTLGPTEDRPSAVLRHVPASTVALAATNDLGATVSDAWALYKTEPSLKDVIDEIEGVLAVAGGIDGAVGWMGDTAFIVDRSETSIAGGVVIVPTDADEAGRFLTSLKSLVALGGAQMGLTVRDEDHNGVTITILDAGDLESLAGLAGGSLPPGVTLPSGHVEIAWAATGDVVVIGSGPDFVRKVLDTTEATSIAGDARFKVLADRGGPTASVTFLDLAAIREMAEGLAGGMGTDVGSYTADVQPYIAPFDALYVSGSVGGDLTTSTVIISVK